MARMNDSKIDKGIQAVNLKLNELKGQKENIEEQVALQKQEIELATKKIDLLNQEFYDAQHKALYNRGAAPKILRKLILYRSYQWKNKQKRKVKALTSSMCRRASNFDC
jgi:hypothetical protein